VTYADRYRADDPDRRFLQSREWRERIRVDQLQREPLCMFCIAMGEIKVAEQVDHIKRPRGDWRLQRDPENFQSLCAPHHQMKSLWERRVEASGKDEMLIIGYRTDGWRVEAPGGTIKRSDRSTAQPVPTLHSHKP
jgi:5-methylcytosine-specific restriction protein A